jgi:membrane fusion protein, heavy metal efflux system
VALSVALLAGCGRDHADEHDHDHHADEPPRTAQLTAWSERHEIFVEHRLPVAGAAVRFLIHVTDLRTLEPRESGPLRIECNRSGVDTFERMEEQPIRAGIYESSLTFPNAGNWAVAVYVPVDGNEDRIELPAVKVYASAHDVAHAIIAEPVEGVRLLKEQQWTLKLRAEPVGERRLIERFAFSGDVRAKPGHSATILAPVTGQMMVASEGALPLPGQRVEAGELLALLRPAFSEAAAAVVAMESGLSRTRTALDQARIAFERVRTLAAAQARSEREVEEAAASLAMARVDYEAAAALQSTYREVGLTSSESALAVPSMELRAPIAGLVDFLGAGLGEPVVAGQRLFTVLDPTVVWLEARVPEMNLERLTDAKGATYELTGARSRFTDITGVEGVLVYTGLQVDPVTRTVPLVYEMPNLDGALRVGQTLTLHVETATADETLAVPESAIVEESGRPVAFVQVSGGTFEKRELALGIRDSGWTQVLGGLVEGERVVTQGAFAVRLASVATGIPSHGHAH